MEDKGHILLVDDEPGILEVCRRTLSRMGFSVTCVGDGSTALKHLESQYFDFVLTDLAMPEPMAGAQLTGEIKRRWPSIDVVIMTAYPALETAIDTLKNGAYDYLAKPFSQDLLQSVVGRCFEKRRLSEELNREKRQHRELEAAYTELQKVEQLKEAILSRVSHELRTPICSGLLAMEALETLRPDLKGLEHSRIMRSSLTQLQKTVEDILLFAKCQQGKMALKKEPTSLKKTIVDVVEHYRPLWEDKQIHMEVRLDKTDDSLYVDAHHIEIAFRHLLLNAIHFNKKDGRVSIESSEHRDGVHISFSDTGPGIPKEKLPKIFDGFYQAAEYLTREVGGLGLGLAIVRQIVEAHGGSVWVQSQQGQGSTFVVSLPREGGPANSTIPGTSRQQTQSNEKSISGR